MICKRSRETVAVVLTLMVLCTLSIVEGECQGSDTQSMLRTLAESYAEVAADGESLIVQFEISPDGDLWYVSSVPEGEVELFEGSHKEAAFTIKMSRETLDRIYRGTMTAFTAAAKGSGADSAPLELEVHESAQELADPKSAMLGFLQHFFVQSRPERILLREECSRVVHGAHAIPLYYAPGFRSAWYKVKQGQRLNEPGDTNPYSQAFIVIAGHGRAKIGDVEVALEAGESYYIPADSDHVLWPQDGEELEIVWFAWGEGA